MITAALILALGAYQIPGRLCIYQAVYSRLEDSYAAQDLLREAGVRYRAEVIDDDDLMFVIEFWEAQS
jgi:hypothetical protein